MATATKIEVTAENTGLLKVQQTEPVAAKVTKLLQEDLETHHVFYNEEGFHNHVVHHLLALYGTGAGEKWLQRGWDANAPYQRAPFPVQESVADDLAEWPKAKQYLGKEQHYSDWLAFFQREIARLGWEDAVKEHLFSGSDRAEDLFTRLFSGFLHPLIQLMYGIEWAQPAIVAEGLAQAAVHRDQLHDFLLAAEAKSREDGEPMPPILELLAAAKADEKLATAAHWDDPNKIYNGICVRAPDEALALCARVKVAADELEARTAEMFHSVVYMAAGAAFHPPNIPKVDFYLMHHVNSSPFFVTVNALPWLETAHKIRLLEWKIRMDVVQYAARRCPELRFDEVTAYAPKDGAAESLDQLLPKMYANPDDGHAIKLVRGILICKEVSNKFEDAPWSKIKGDVWVNNILQMVADSSQVQEGVKQWARSAGFEEAWKEFPDRT